MDKSHISDGRKSLHALTSGTGMGHLSDVNFWLVIVLPLRHHQGSMGSVGSTWWHLILEAFKALWQDSLSEPDNMAVPVLEGKELRSKKD